jgi:peptide deformylase
MAVRDIRFLGDEVLRTPAEDVTELGPEIERLIDDMWATMYHAEGIGLAAPQIGVSLRVMVIDVRESDEEGGNRLALVNPRIVEASKKMAKGVEGCLSIPGMEEVVERPKSVRVVGTDPSGTPVEVEADGLFARALQHEIDHLDGVLFIDRISPLKRRLLLKKWRKAQEEDG